MPDEEVVGKTIGENKAEALKGLIPLLNWERIYSDLLQFRRMKGLQQPEFYGRDAERDFEAGQLYRVVFGRSTGAPPLRRFASGGGHRPRRAEEIHHGVL
jgi:hypothetical protein